MNEMEIELRDLMKKANTEVIKSPQEFVTLRRKYDLLLNDIFREYTPMTDLDDPECYDPWELHKWMLKSRKILNARLKANDKKDYYYLVTFTLDPKKNSKGKTTKEIEQYIHIQARRKQALHIEKASISQESHKDGRPHWHLAIITNKALRSDAFAYYSKLYGKVKIDPSKTYKSWDDLYGYISKENTPISLI